MRHGLAEEIRNGQEDVDRPLAEVGKKFIPYLGEFDEVFSSPAKRCVETARLSTDHKNPSVVNALSTHLWNDNIDDNDGWELVEKCYYLDGKMVEAPLSVAWKNISLPEAQAWKSITAYAMNDMFHSFGNRWRRVLICTHQFHAQAIALDILKKQGSDDLKKFIRDMYLAPGGAITLNVEAKITMPFRGRSGGIFFY
ncbi:MAG: hypothetical protein ACD_15C00126G0002 [uncultured bacterium]|nr:MAG: hypothetical protein ACD_15C00126G0002 [uncultured bacterium]